MAQLPNIKFGNCARCGRNHIGLLFKEFSINPIVFGEEKFTHWAICPITGEPIIMKVVQESNTVQFAIDI